MVEVFKTNVADLFQRAVLTFLINSEFPEYEVNFDLEDCDRILRIESEKIDHIRVLEILRNEGYYCDVLI